MTQAYDAWCGSPPAANYERSFVPHIGAPVADDLLAMADLRPGERVLDVACGTGVVTRLAAEQVGGAGTVAGLDVNPGMLAVARSLTGPDSGIAWYEASAESMPLADASFDVVLCQMGLQFVPDRPAALREMRRVLDSGGRALISVPGPMPPMFAIMRDSLARHLGPGAAGFIDLVFSLHDPGELAALLQSAGFRETDTRAVRKGLHLPPPAEFLWQYICSTPIAEAAAKAGPEKRDTLERGVCSAWETFADDGAMALEVDVTTAIGKA